MNIKLQISLFIIPFILPNSHNAHTQILQLKYSTFLGGSGEDRAHGMAVDSRGNVYLTAPVQSDDFPVTSRALNTTSTGIYAAKLGIEGDSLILSTYLGVNGGANYAHGVAIDNEGCIYIAGNTTNANFPTTTGAFDRTFHGPRDQYHGDAFVVKLNPAGEKIIYSTFLGGTGMDICGKITVDAHGHAYVLGSTSSTDLPVTPGAFDTTFNGGEQDGRADIFVAKLDSTGNRLIYCTYIGGSSTDLYGNDILVDGSGCVYFAATTASQDFPITSRAYDHSYNGGSGFHGAGDGVLVKLNASGTALDYSTFFGGSKDDYARCLAMDVQGNVYVGGSSESFDLPTTPNAYSHTNHKGGYFAKFNSELNQLLYSTFWDAKIQAIAVYDSSTVILTGSTESVAFPVTPDAFDTTANGVGDIFISVLNLATQSLIYSTYFGGKNNDVVVSMLLDHHSLYLSGNTVSMDFPISAHAFDETFNGGTSPWGGDAFIAKFILNNMQSDD